MSAIAHSSPVKPEQTYIAQQDLGWMWCRTCERYPWDCPCAQSVECDFCGIEQEDAKYIEARGETYFCDGSTDGLHEFVSMDKEP